MKVALAWMSSNGAFMCTGDDLIADAKWLCNEQQDTREKVLENVPKGEADSHTSISMCMKPPLGEPCGNTLDDGSQDEEPTEGASARLAFGPLWFPPADASTEKFACDAPLKR